jgi:electron transport complex protein RnfC
VLVDGFLPTFIRRKFSPPVLGQLPRDKPSSIMEIPERVVVPLQDKPDTPYEAKIKLGEPVRSGQMIGWMGKPPLHLGIHASISGRVDQTGLMPHPLGLPVHSISIVSDGEGEQCDFTPLDSRGLESSGQKVFEGLQEMGIPLNYRLIHARGFKVSNLLINATEFEPYIVSKHQMLRENVQGIIKGLRVLIKSFSARRAVILLEKNNAPLVKLLKEGAREVPEINIRVVGRTYPETAGEFLLKKVFSRGLSVSNDSSSMDAMLVDLPSLLAIYNAWFSGMPFIEQLITVAGSGIRDPQNIWVKIGTLLMHVIQHTGGFLPRLGRVTVGGPLMGIPQHSLEVPLIKRARGVFAAVAFLFDEHRRSRFYKRVPCIKCAKCVDVCPVFIIPNIIVDLIDNKFFNEVEQRGVFLCLECGLCEYVCPSRIPLLELIKLGKVSLKGEGSLLTRSNLVTLSF